MRGNDAPSAILLTPRRGYTPQPSSKRSTRPKRQGGIIRGTVHNITGTDNNPKKSSGQVANPKYRLKNECRTVAEMLRHTIDINVVPTR